MKSSIILKLIKKTMITVVMFALFMIGTGVSLICDAATVETLTASPSSCNVGDTITLTVENTSPDSKYSYSYVIDGGSAHTITGFISDSVYYYTPVESGNYIFRVAILTSTSTITYISSNSVVVSDDESSDDESSDESSDDESSDESSDDESSFDPMGWMPSNWRGDDYVQPSAESTPDLSYEDLPSNLDAFWVSENLADIIARAFKAFPAKLIVLMIPTIICLFVAWWLHK